MDEVTNTLVTNFTTFLENELKRDKRYHTFQVADWSIHDYKVSVKAFLNQQMIHLHFDLREIKDNPNHFVHLIPTAMDQLKETT